MHIGMTLPVTEPGWTREIALEWIRRIDAGPFHSLALGERNAFPTPDIIALMGACAALTSRVKIVASVAVVTMHDAVLQAKQFATIDMLCEGRLVLGVGIGGREEDYRAIGADLSRRRIAGLEETVRTMRRVWAGEKVVPGVLRPVEPFPVQPGGPPILAGVLGPKATANAAKWADGVSGMAMTGRAQEARLAFDLAERSWRDAGREERPILNTATWFAVGEGDRPREQIRTHLLRYFNWMPEAREGMAASCGFAGTATELRQMLAAMRDVGTDELQLIPTTIDPDEVDRIADIIGVEFGPAAVDGGPRS
jgi:alkanesulfonate monooxygenase SsuD/methylene tetrahydromethanopterin reductase-like flavin-dependent oxidoreductase (luciferase family)